MEELKRKISEILEIEDLDITRKFADYESWDSLGALLILAMLDADYHLSMKAADLVEFDSIEAFCKKVLKQ